MTEKDIIRLAEESQLWAHKDREYAAIERFAKLVAAAEREWINLTVQERENLRDEYEDNPYGLISAVQMMLKEKNAC